MQQQVETQQLEHAKDFLLPRVNNIVTGPVRGPKTLQNNCPAIVRRELATEKTSSDNCPAAPEIHLLVHMQLDLPDSPDIVQILFGYCPAIVQ